MNGQEVGSLYYDINIDDKNLKSQLADTDKSVQNLGGSVQSTGEKIQAGFRETAKVIAVAGAGLTVFAKQSTDFTEEYVKNSRSLSREIGVSIEEASRLTAAFARMGIESDATQQMFGILAKKISASADSTEANRLATEGLQIQIKKTQKDITDTTDAISKHGDKTGALSLKLEELNNKLAQEQDQLLKTAGPLEQLGISVTNANGVTKGFNDVLFEVADKFKAMPDGATKTALAMELFGRSGKDMIKVLDLGSAGIQNLENQADKLGLTLTAGTIGAINALIQSQKDLKEQTDALKIAVGTATAPALTTFNKGLLTAMQTAMQAHEPFHTMFVDILAFGGPVMGAIASFVAFAGNISSITASFAKLALGGGIVILVLVALAVIGFEVYTHWQTLHALFQQVAAHIQTILAPTINILKEGFTSFMMAIQSVWAALQQNLLPALSQLWDAVMRVWNAINPAFMEGLKILALIVGVVVVASVWFFISALNVAVQVLSFIISVVSNVINWISNLISWFGTAAVSVVRFFRDLPGVILGAIGGFGGLLYNAGADLIRGLINGMKDMVGRAVQAVKDIGSSIVNGIKGILKIFSPSAVFHDIGQNIGQGLANGIAASQALAVDAMSSLTASVIAPAINISANGSAAAPAQGNTYISIGTVQDRQDADYILRHADQNQLYESKGLSPRS